MGDKSKIEPTTLAYLAGVIDSDGFITASSSVRSGRTYCAPRVGIAGTRREPHDLAASLFGGSVLSYEPKAERAHHRTQFQWVREGDTAAHVIVAVLPYLRVKRVQAELAVELQAARLDERLARAGDEDVYPWVPTDYDPVPSLVALAHDIRALNVRGRTVVMTR